MLEKEKVLTKSVKHLFNTIDESDILKEELGVWMVNGKALLPGEQSQLIAEAQIFVKTKLWQVLQKDVQHQANKKMFLESKDLYDLMMGKSWMYVLDCIKTRLESLEKERGVFNTKTK